MLLVDSIWRVAKSTTSQAISGDQFQIWNMHVALLRRARLMVRWCCTFLRENKFVRLMYLVWFGFAGCWPPDGVSFFVGGCLCAKAERGNKEMFYWHLSINYTSKCVFGRRYRHRSLFFHRFFPVCFDCTLYSCFDLSHFLIFFLLLFVFVLGMIYLLGGDGGYGAIKHCEVYDVVKDTYTSLPPMIHPRTRHAAVFSNGSLAQLFLLNSFFHLNVLFQCFPFLLVFSRLAKCLSVFDVSVSVYRWSISLSFSFS